MITRDTERFLDKTSSAWQTTNTQIKKRERVGETYCEKERLTVRES